MSEALTFGVGPTPRRLACGPSLGLLDLTARGLHPAVPSVDHRGVGILKRHIVDIVGIVDLSVGTGCCNC